MSERTNNLKKATTKMIVRTFFAVLVPGLLGVAIGLQVDRFFGTTPWITLGALGIAYITSWVIVAKMAKDIHNTVKEANKDLK